VNVFKLVMISTLGFLDYAPRTKNYLWAILLDSRLLQTDLVFLVEPSRQELHSYRTIIVNKVRNTLVNGSRGHEWTNHKMGSQIRAVARD
jgi:hypothetical protein